MKIKKFLIANGNSTLLVWDCPLWERKQIIKTYLGKVEHLGFVSVQNGFPKLTMMGNELCINAILALASQYSTSGNLFMSGINEPIYYQNSDGKTFIEISLPYQKIKNVILFSGIGFLLQYINVIKYSKENLRYLCQRYNLPAFGVIYSIKNKIEPYVYVKETNTLFRETACGSGSIAFSILTGYKDIIQPTGEIINVQKFGSRFTVSTKVVKIEERMNL